MGESAFRNCALEIRTARCYTRALMQRSFVYLPTAIQDHGACNASIMPTSRIASNAIYSSFTFKPDRKKRCQGGQKKGVLLLLTSWSRALLQKLTDSQLVNKFPAFYVINYTGPREILLEFVILVF